MDDPEIIEHAEKSCRHNESRDADRKGYIQCPFKAGTRDYNIWANAYTRQLNKLSNDKWQQLRRVRGLDDTLPESKKQ